MVKTGFPPLWEDPYQIKRQYRPHLHHQHSYQLLRLRNGRRHCLWLQRRTKHRRWRLKIHLPVSSRPSLTLLFSNLVHS